MSIEKESMQNTSIQNKSTSNQTLDKKNRKLPTPSERGKPMTEEEWDYYFECRKKYDKPMTREEINALLAKSSQLDSTRMDSPDLEEWVHLMQMMPVTPSAALALKHVQGFQALMEVNLYDAKQAYPDEF